MWGSELLSSQHYQEEAILQLAGLEAGVYVVEINTSGTVLYRKVVKR